MDKQLDILLFIADDLGWKDTGVYDSGYGAFPDPASEPDWSLLERCGVRTTSIGDKQWEQ